MLGTPTRPSLVHGAERPAACRQLCACPARAAASESRLCNAEVICVTQLKSVRGVVEATAQNAPDRYGVKIGQLWYDGFGPCPVARGQEVEVDYGESGRFRDVQEIRPAEAPAHGQGEAARDMQIARAVALKCAARLYADGWATAKEITDLAEKLEKWLRAND